MLSSEHTNVENINFLNKSYYNAKRLLINETTFTHVEVDFSWPRLHSVFDCFNAQTLDMYFNACWERLYPDAISTYRIKTVLHICSAHIIHRFNYKIDRKLNKRLKDV